ncbi:MAG: hypothetical protein WC654_00775 [Patescibacteria group bacterium]
MMKAEDRDSLASLLGPEVADKAFQIECVWKYLANSIPRTHFASGYGWDEVGRVQTLENNERDSIRRIAMMGAISIVLNLPPDTAEKMASIVGPWFWDNQTREKAQLLYELKKEQTKCS